MKYSDDNYHSTITDAIKKLNYDWYLAKKEEFTKLSPDSNTGLVTFSVTHRSTQYEQSDEFPRDLESGEPFPIEIFEHENRADISLADYCGLYLPITKDNLWGDVPDDFHVPRAFRKDYNYREIADELFGDILEYLPPESSVEERKTFAANVEQDFNTIMEDFLEDKPTETQYRQAMQGFRRYFLSRLYNHFAKEMMLKKPIEKRAFLDFNLSQNQMIALLFVLSRGNIIAGEQTQITKFAKEHFRFSVEGKYQSPLEIDKLNEIWKKCYGAKEKAAYLQRVITKIEKAIESA